MQSNPSFNQRRVPVHAFPLPPPIVPIPLQRRFRRPPPHIPQHHPRTNTRPPRSAALHILKPPLPSASLHHIPSMPQPRPPSLHIHPREPCFTIPRRWLRRACPRLLRPGQTDTLPARAWSMRILKEGVAFIWLVWVTALAGASPAVAEGALPDLCARGELSRLPHGDPDARDRTRSRRAARVGARATVRR
jgi:hypothetical protein